MQHLSAVELDLRAQLLESVGQFSGAIQAQRQSIGIFRQVNNGELPPDEKRIFELDFAASLSKLARLENKGDISLDLLNNALDIVHRIEPDTESRSLEASIGQSIANFALPNYPDEAREVLKRVVDINDQLQKDWPGVPQFRINRSEIHTLLAHLACTEQKFDVAEEELRRAMELACEIADKYPENFGFQSAAGAAQLEVATFLTGGESFRFPARPTSADQQEIVSIFESAIERQTAAVALFNRSHAMRMQLAMADFNLAGFYKRSNNVDRAMYFFRESREQWLKLVELFPQSQWLSRYYARAGASGVNIAGLFDRGEEENVESLNRARSDLLKALATEPVFSPARRFIVHCYQDLALSYLQRDGTDSGGDCIENHQLAGKCLKDLLSLDPANLHGMRLSNVGTALVVLSRCIKSAHGDSNLSEDQRNMIVTEHAGLARSLLDEAYRTIGDSNDEELHQFALNELSIGASLAMAGGGDESNPAIEFTLSALEKGKELSSRNPAPLYRDLLIHCYGNIGISLLSNRDYAKHEKFLREQILVLEELLPLEQAGQIPFSLYGVNPRPANQISAELEKQQRFLAETLVMHQPTGDPREALDILLHLDGPTPTHNDGWGDIGAAYCRAGEFQQAIDALDQSISLRSEDDKVRLAYDRVFLSLSYHGLKKDEQARQQFSLARQICEKFEHSLMSPGDFASATAIEDLLNEAEVELQLGQ